MQLGQLYTFKNISFNEALFIFWNVRTYLNMPMALKSRRI